MAISGIIFDNQVPTAKGLRGAFKSALSDGIVSGCEITYSGMVVSIDDGLINVSGGIFQISGSEDITIANTSSFARIKAKIDLSESSTTSTFNQVSFAVDYSNTANGFAELIQEDINTGSSDAIYEAEICVVSISNNAISGIVRIANAAAKVQYGDTLPNDAPDGTIFLLKV